METLRDALSVLTPQFFDWLVLLVIVVGLAAGRASPARRPAPPAP